ncbi:MAG: tRNA (adenosine(37)-N6)-threonylcarbamoyltransferase complex ATPase subunit type 1 TsaE [Deltaproteobacteria bacterium]|jgi:tRNA threonylcarbamoyladenosine biosynthesis protein TsaE|nr:tRNA (adenosine(37)-N6)-threonylcarbamoyltransferase complex ATPase subunit type 1 TsaE [Deltaproteobacteria bacterium]
MIITENLPSLPGSLELAGPEITKKAGALMGQALLKESLAAFLVTLEGPLGAGKTTLCQGLAVAMGAQAQEVVSPTFTLCNVYSAQKTLYHLDLYRLDPLRAAQEFIGAGLDECLDGLCLVEWPERLSQNFWPDQRLGLKFELSDQGRTLKAFGQNQVAQRLWQAALSLS